MTFYFTTQLDKYSSTWSGYDKTVATCHMHNYGVVVLDSYKQPIDDYDYAEELLLHLRPERREDFESGLVVEVRCSI